LEPNADLRTLQGMDAEDWQRVRAGDGEAFGRIWDRHRDRIRRHAHGLTGQWADAEDILAITFLEAWRNRSRVRLVEGSTLPWLLVTATNTGNNFRRSARRYARALERLPEAQPVAPSDYGDLAATRALSLLSVSDQKIITLCVLFDYTAAEAAGVLGVPIGTVKSRLSRAKVRLTMQLTTHNA
jgi:RNA polymerase sigma factor (sigma-70 family)